MRPERHLPGGQIGDESAINCSNIVFRVNAWVVEASTHTNDVKESSAADLEARADGRQADPRLPLRPRSASLPPLSLSGQPVPVPRPPQSLVEVDLRLPAELCADRRRVEELAVDLARRHALAAHVRLQ